MQITKEWFVDFQYVECPQEVLEEIHGLWGFYKLLNDYCILKRDMNIELEEEMPLTYAWLKQEGIPEGERVLLHWWW